MDREAAMLDEAAATELVRAELGAWRAPMGVIACARTTDDAWFVFQVQTVAYIASGELAHALVGVGPVLVNRRSGEIRVFRAGWDVEAMLEDERDAAAAGSRVWVVRPRQDGAREAWLRLRPWLGCAPQVALDLARGGPWLVGSRREVHAAVACLAALGVVTDADLVDHAGTAEPLADVSLDEGGLRAALLRRAERGVHG
jgi:hypothetical protein